MLTPAARMSLRASRWGGQGAAMTWFLLASLARYMARSVRARQGEVLGAGVVMQGAFGVHRDRISGLYCRPLPFVAQRSLNRRFLVMDGESLQHLRKYSLTTLFRAATSIRVWASEAGWHPTGLLRRLRRDRWAEPSNCRSFPQTGSCTM